MTSSHGNITLDNRFCTMGCGGQATDREYHIRVSKFLHDSTVQLEFRNHKKVTLCYSSPVHSTPLHSTPLHPTPLHPTPPPPPPPATTSHRQPPTANPQPPTTNHPPPHTHPTNLQPPTN